MAASGSQGLAWPVWDACDCVGLGWQQHWIARMRLGRGHSLIKAWLLESICIRLLATTALLGPFHSVEH